MSAALSTKCKLAVRFLGCDPWEGGAWQHPKGSHTVSKTPDRSSLSSASDE